MQFVCICESFAFNMAPAAAPHAAPTILRTSCPTPLCARRRLRSRSRPSSLPPPPSPPKRPEQSTKASDLDKVEVVGKYVEKPASVKYTEPLRDTPQTITVINREVMDEQNLLGLRDVADHAAGHHLRRGRRRRRLRRQHHPARLQRQQRHHHRRRARQRAVLAHRLVQPASRSNWSTARTRCTPARARSAATSTWSASRRRRRIHRRCKPARAPTATAASPSTATSRSATAPRSASTRWRTRTTCRAATSRRFERWGIAPSIASAWARDTRVTLSYFHQTDDNIPQYGVPYFSAYGGPLPGVEPRELLRLPQHRPQEIDVDMLTGVFDHDFSDTPDAAQPGALPEGRPATASSTRRRARGAWPTASIPRRPGRVACTASEPGTFCSGHPSGPRGNVRDTQNSIAISQTDLTSISTPAASSTRWWPACRSRTRPSTSTPATCCATPTARPSPLPPMSIADPYNVYAGPMNYIRTGLTEGELDNAGRLRLRHARSSTSSGC